MAVTAAIATTRTSGIVPLGVFFDAVGTLSDATTREFHEVYYEWDFDDSGAGNHPTMTGMPDRNRNEAFGPLAYHVFETAGTYTVTLRVFDGASYDEETVEITASDWSEGVTGTTLVVSTDGDFTGAPTHTQELTSSDFDAAINNNIATRKRILFKRGQTFTSSASAGIDVAGPGIIGAFGSGDKPLVEVSGTSMDVFQFSAHGADDWRIMDFEVDGNSQSEVDGVEVWREADNNLVLRIDFHHCMVNVRMSPSIGDFFENATLWDGWGIVDCTMTTTLGGSGSNGSYIAAQRLGYIGNALSDVTGGEHVTRWPFLYKAAISHNYMYGPAASKLVVKLHNADISMSPGPVDTQYIVFSYNKCQTLTAWNVVFGPQDNVAYADETVTDVICERCWFMPQAASPFTNQDQACISMGSNHTYRNNLFDISGTDGLGIAVDDFFGGGNYDTGNIHVYNNTFYRASGSAFTAVAFGEGTGHLAYNNLGYSPGGGSMLSGSGYTASNNTSDVTVDPDFASATPSNFVDFKITSGSYAIGAGIDTEPVFGDAFGSARVDVENDTGFHQFTEGAFPWDEAGEFNPAWATSANPQGVLA